VALEQADKLTEDLVLGMVAQYQRTQTFRHQNLIRGMGILQGFEKNVAKLILEETNTPETDSLNVLTDSAAPRRNDGPSQLEIPSGDAGDQQEEAQSPDRKTEKRSPVWKRVFGKSS